MKEIGFFRSYLAHTPWPVTEKKDTYVKELCCITTPKVNRQDRGHKGIPEGHFEEEQGLGGFFWSCLSFDSQKAKYEMEPHFWPFEAQAFLTWSN